MAYIVEGDAGATDGEIISRAHAESRLLLTEDKDFGELAFRWGVPCPELSCCASSRIIMPSRGRG